ncbi:MAG: PCRF domain-containing protein [Treponema sp.]|nr:PCRF domain-containing protein [Treponema sp.]
MYSSFAQKKRWKLEVLKTKEKNSGGIEIIIFSIRGRNVYKKLQYEIGVHRVQCVPKNQTSGKILTSTISVAVFPDVHKNALNIDIVTDMKNQLNQNNSQERIRTYNFPQNRLTDHRINFTLYTLNLIMQEELEEIFSALKSRL